MIAVPTVQATKADIIQTANALFDFRQTSANDTDPRNRHPIMYRGYKWDALPISEKMYYCDMAAVVLQSFGIRTTMPEFEGA